MPYVNKEKQDTFRQQCRKHHLSITPQRRAIYEILAASDAHPSAEDVYEQVRRSFPEIAIDTVYRTLATFADIGLVNVVEGYGEARRYDPETVSHHHFRCRRCNKIVDFKDAGLDRVDIPKRFKTEYHVTNVKVVLEGFCEKCTREAGEAGGATP